MKLATEEWPSFANPFLQWPFHFARFRFLGDFLKTTEPPTARNSTSVSGPRQNRSRISFGIVTWPRSPIFILVSMNHDLYRQAR